MSANLEFKVGDKAVQGLFLRSQPVVQNSTKIALLPMGQTVTKKAESEVKPWWAVKTNLQGAVAEGFVNSDFLVPVSSFVAPTSHSSLSPVHLRTSNPVTRKGISRAFPLNESGQPTRNPTDATADKVKQLGSIIKWLKVDQSARYTPKPGTTFCNIYAYDYCYLANVYLPRVWWSREAIEKLRAGTPVTPVYAKTVDEINANSLFNWLKNFGPEFGWTRTFDLTEMQNAANDGQVGIICAQRKDLNRSGHICAVVPETSTQKAVRNGATVSKPLQSQAGAHNFQYSPSSRPAWWTGDQFRDFGFWIHG